MILSFYINQIKSIVCGMNGPNTHIALDLVVMAFDSEIELKLRDTKNLNTMVKNASGQQLRASTAVIFCNVPVIFSKFCPLMMSICIKKRKQKNH